VTLTTRPHLGPRSRMSGTIYFLSQLSPGWR